MTVKFKTMYMNEVTAEISIVNNKLEKAVLHTTKMPKALFCAQPWDAACIDMIIADRCFEKNNAAAAEFLEYYGLDHYEPWDIVRKTHGVMLTDYRWLLFEGENLTWEEVGHDR